MLRLPAAAGPDPRTATSDEVLPPVLLRQEVADGVEVLSAHGAMGDGEAGSLVCAVERALAAGPRAVVLDLAQVSSITDGALAALCALPRRPSSALVVCPPAQVRDLPGLVLATDRASALARVEDAPTRWVERIPIESALCGPAKARRAVSGCCERLGLKTVQDDMLLVVSEMVTNAIRHAMPPICLEIAAGAEDIVVSVYDGSPARPAARSVPDEAEGGRGMMLVDLLAVDHGVRPQPPGKAVWARLSRRKELGS